MVDYCIIITDVAALMCCQVTLPLPTATIDAQERGGFGAAE